MGLIFCKYYPHIACFSCSEDVIFKKYGNWITRVDTLFVTTELIHQGKNAEKINQASYYEAGVMSRFHVCEDELIFSRIRDILIHKI